MNSFFQCPLPNTTLVDYFCIPFVDPKFTCSWWQGNFRRNIVHAKGVQYTILDIVAQHSPLHPVFLEHLLSSFLLLASLSFTPSIHSLLTTHCRGRASVCGVCGRERKTKERKKGRVKFVSSRNK